MEDSTGTVAVFQSLSRAQLFATPSGCSTPVSSALHYLPEVAQIHILCVGVAI